jgi:hypothetical protein
LKPDGQIGGLFQFNVASDGFFDARDCRGSKFGTIF